MIVPDEAKQSLKNKLKSLSSIVHENVKHRSNQVVEEIKANDAVAAKPLTGLSEDIIDERDGIQSDKSESNITDSSCKIESNLTCHCRDLAVQVKRIESYIKLLKGQIGENTFCFNINTFQRRKNRLRHDLEQANVLIKDLQTRINILQSEKSINIVSEANLHNA